MDRTTSAKELNEVSASLREKYVSLANAKNAESSAKASVYEAEIPAGASVSQADRLATANSAAFSRTVVTLIYQIEALEEQRDHLRFMLKHGLEGFV